MTLRKIKVITGNCARVVIYRNAEWNEYIVRVEGSNAIADYHTDDKTDALSTAQYMADKGCYCPCLG